MKKIPASINPDKIVEAIVEVRFNSTLPDEAIFGIIYSAINDQFDDLKKLPIMQMPDAMRTQDPQLRYQPYYHLTSKNSKVILRIGPRVINFIAKAPYIGWSNFSEIVFDALDKISKSKVINVYEKIGVRYVNYFEEAILNDINVVFTVNSDPIKEKETFIRIVKEDEKYTVALQLTNNQTILIDKKENYGSLIDIDYTYTVRKKESHDEIKVIISEAHNKEKSMFFSLLSEKKIESLNPKYEE